MKVCMYLQTHDMRLKEEICMIIGIISIAVFIIVAVLLIKGIHLHRRVSQLYMSQEDINECFRVFNKRGK